MRYRPRMKTRLEECKKNTRIRHCPVCLDSCPPPFPRAVAVRPSPRRPGAGLRRLLRPECRRARHDGRKVPTTRFRRLANVLRLALLCPGEWRRNHTLMTIRCTTSGTAMPWWVTAEPHCWLWWVQAELSIVLPKPFANKPSHSTCCHLAIGSGTNILPIQ